MQNGQMKGQVGNSLPLPGLSGVANGPVGKSSHPRLNMAAGPLDYFSRDNWLTLFTQVTSSRGPSTTTATSRPRR